MSRRLPTARTSTVVLVSTKITRQSPTSNRAPGRPVRRLMLPTPVLANRSILASMSARTSGGSLRNSRRASWVHVIVFTKAIYQYEMIQASAISQSVMSSHAHHARTDAQPSITRLLSRHLRGVGGVPRM